MVLKQLFREKKKHFMGSEAGGDETIGSPWSEIVHPPGLS